MSTHDRTEPQPWERRPGEGSKAHAAFIVYRDLGRARSLDEVARHVGGPQEGRKRAATGQLQRWSRRWGWVARAADWDAYLDAQGREAQAETVRKLQEKHQLHLRGCFNRLILTTRDVDWDNLTPTQVVSLTAQLIHLERLVHGQPVSVERVQHAGVPGQPVGHVVATTTFEPSAELLAQTMTILADVEALGEPSEETPAGCEPTDTSALQGEASQTDGPSQTTRRSRGLERPGRPRANEVSSERRREPPRGDGHSRD